jgi:hypothetical protein
LFGLQQRAFTVLSTLPLEEMLATGSLADAIAANPMVTLAATAGAGRGLVAAVDIMAGTCILEEDALCWVSSDARAKFSTAAADAAEAFLHQFSWHPLLDETLRLATLKQLAPEGASQPTHSFDGPGTAAALVTLRRVLSLPPEAVLPAALLQALLAKRILDENSFSLSARAPLLPSGALPAASPAAAPSSPAASACSVVGLAASMLNHSCSPTVLHCWSWRTLPRAGDAGEGSGGSSTDISSGGGELLWPVVRVIALCDIKAGTQLCTRYIDVETRTRHARRQLLRQRYGFDCCCARCGGPGDANKRGDDAVRLLCPECDKGYVLGACWNRSGAAGAACSACGSTAASCEPDVQLDERTALLQAFFAASVAATKRRDARDAVEGPRAGCGGAGGALSTVAEADEAADAAAHEDGDAAAACGSSAASATGMTEEAEEEAALGRLRALLHPADSALFKILFNRALRLFSAHGLHELAGDWALKGDDAPSGDAAGAADSELRSAAATDAGDGDALTPAAERPGESQLAALQEAFSLTTQLLRCMRVDGMAYLQPSTRESVLALHTRLCEARVARQALGARPAGPVECPEVDTLQEDLTAARADLGAVRGLIVAARG